MFEEKQTRRPRCLILTTSWSFAPPRRAFNGYYVLPVFFVFYGPTIKRTTPHPASGHKLQKPSKESGLFQSLGTIRLILFFFY